MKSSALVVIDLQNDITANYKEIITKVNEAADIYSGVYSIIVEVQAHERNSLHSAEKREEKCMLIKY